MVKWNSSKRVISEIADLNLILIFQLTQKKETSEYLFFMKMLTQAHISRILFLATASIFLIFLQENNMDQVTLRRSRRFLILFSLNSHNELIKSCTVTFEEHSVFFWFDSSYSRCIFIAIVRYVMKINRSK